MLGITSNIKILKKERTKQLAFIDKLLFQGYVLSFHPSLITFPLLTDERSVFSEVPTPFFSTYLTSKLPAKKYINIAMGIRWHVATSIRLQTNLISVMI